MSKKHKYRSDYEVHETQVSGRKQPKYKTELKYVGKYYVLETKESEFKTLKWMNMLSMSLIAGIFLGLGFLNNQGGRLIYVILPYILMFLPIYYGILGSIKLLSLKDRMTVIEYERSSIRVKKSSLSLTVLAISTAIGEGVYLLRIINKQGDNSLDYIFFAGIIIILIFSLFALRIQARIHVNEEK